MPIVCQVTATAQHGRSFDELRNRTAFGDHLAGTHSHRGVRQPTAPFEVIDHLPDPAMVPGNRAPARNVPDDVFCHQLDDRINRSARVHGALTAVKLAYQPYGQASVGIPSPRRSVGHHPDEPARVHLALITSCLPERRGGGLLIGDDGGQSNGTEASQAILAREDQRGGEGPCGATWGAPQADRSCLAIRPSTRSAIRLCSAPIRRGEANLDLAPPSA